MSNSAAVITADIRTKTRMPTRSMAAQ
jgi:hypothetical protein